MKAYHLYCEYSFEGANLCDNSGVYLSKEEAIKTLMEGLKQKSFYELSEDDWDIEEIEIE